MGNPGENFTVYRQPIVAPVKGHSRVELPHLGLEAVNLA
jgi:hypothetical protein